MEININNLLVARTLATSVKTLLGPHHSLKCCSSDGEAVVCSSASKLLQYIDIQHPAGYIINDVCQGQYKKYQTNCKTLVCMAGFWSRAAQHLQDQGIPVPVIVKLFDDALAVCEEVCLEISGPVIEALQNHKPPQPMDALIAGKDIESSLFASCQPRDETDNLEEFSLVSDKNNTNSDDVDDLSWYFNGHIPGANGHVPGIFGHIPCGNNHIPGIHGHLPRILNTETTNEPDLSVTLLQNVLPEMKNCNKMEDLAIGVTRSELIASIGKHEDVSLGAEYCKSESGRVLQLTPTSEESVKFKIDPSLSGKDVDEEEDEFEASFLDAVSSSNHFQFSHQGCPPGKAQRTELASDRDGIKEVSVEEKRKDKLSCTFVQTGNCDKRNAKKKLEHFNTGNKEKSASFSGIKERKGTDELMSILSEKMRSKNKLSRNQVSLSEICKGSRHFNDSSTKPMASTTSVSSECSSVRYNSIKDILSHREGDTATQIGKPDLVHSLSPTKTLSVEKLEASCTSKTSAMFKTKPGQAEKQSRRDSMSLTKTLSDAKCHTRPSSKLSLQFTPETGKAEKSDLRRPIPQRKVTPIKNTERSLAVERNTQLLAKIGERLSHGKEQEMKLAIEVINSLFRCSGEDSLQEFDVHLNMIHTELILGPPSSFSQAIDGLLLENTAPFPTAATVHVTTEHPLFIALVNGDVTPVFRHAGLNSELQIHRVNERTEDFKKSFFSHEKNWYDRVIETLASLNIGVLVAKGVVQDSIIDFCTSHNILVLSNIPYPKLQLLSFATGSTLVTYLTDLREQDVGGTVTIDTWELGWAPSAVRHRKDKRGRDGVKEMCQYVLVKDANRGSGHCEDFTSPLQTVLLCSTSKDLLCDTEERFWNSIHRVKNSLNCGRVLPGAGATEIACIRRLHELAGKQSDPEMPGFSLSGWLQESLELCRPLAYSVFTQGFKEFLASILRNSGKYTTIHGMSTFLEELISEGSSLGLCGSFHEEMSDNYCSRIGMFTENMRDHERTSGPDFFSREPAQSFPRSLDDRFTCGDENLVWDDYTAKIEAWKRAIGIVRILLQSDMLVETGLTSGANQADLF